MMPFDLQWHDKLPVLVVTYKDKLTLKEYRQLVEQRAAMLDEGPADVVVLADMQGFTGFPDAHQVDRSPDVTELENVRSQVIILPETMPRRVINSASDDLSLHFATYVFADFAQALDAARALLA